jgi:hypothetical protein
MGSVRWINFYKIEKFKKKIVKESGRMANQTVIETRQVIYA